MPGDIRRPYLEACDHWTRADREYHLASVGVACGTATAERLAVARANLDDALGDVTATRNDMGELLLALIRACADDDHWRYALLLSLLGILRPALEPLADRLENVETVLVRGAA